VGYEARVLMRGIAGTVGLCLLTVAASGCYLYFDDDEGEPGRPTHDAGVARPDAQLIDAGRPPCEYPSYPEECAEVDHFECGFGFACDGDTLVARWHEHVFCGDYEEIVEYTCSHECADGCVASRGDWPDVGADLVAAVCTETGTGTSCDGQCGLALEGCFCDEACAGYGDCCDDYDAQCTGCAGLDEEACSANPDCKPVYSGTNCTDPDGNTCTGGDDCTCASFEFAVCVDQD
jgi:hypothetical protein